MFRPARRPIDAPGPGTQALAFPTPPIIFRVDPPSGRIAGGTLVTIYGANFRNNNDGSAPSVTFDGVAATTVIVVNTGTITCATPAGESGVADIAVTINSQTGYLYGGFSYIEGRITRVIPAHGGINGAYSATIEGFNFIDGSFVTFGGIAATNVTFIDDQHIVVTVPAGELPGGFVDVVVHEPITAQFWTAVATPAGPTWRAVDWSPTLSLFAAVAHDRVMTSPDGITWTDRGAVTANVWVSVTWSPSLGLFVAVGRNAATTSNVMTSPDGIVWTVRPTPSMNRWTSVIWSPELNLFAAVGLDSANRVMTSPDGITWTLRAAAAKTWKSVTWSPDLGLFVAVSNDGTTSDAMTSADGITWTPRTTPVTFGLEAVSWSPELGKFLAVATVTSAAGNDGMTSPNGITWTAIDISVPGVNTTLVDLAWSPELQLFAAAAVNAGGNNIFTTHDGSTWAQQATPAAHPYQGIGYSPQLSRFAAVGSEPTALEAVYSTVTPGIEVTKRGGFQYTLLTRGEDIRRIPGVTIRDILNNQPNACSFTIDGTSNVPVVGEMIEIVDEEDGDRLLFRGTVQNVTQIYEGQIDQLAFNVQCVDFTFLFNRKRPVGYYLTKSASDVVKDLVANFAPGFTTNHVQTNLAKVSVILDGSQDFVSVMNQIAAAIGGGHWYIDYDQDVHFFHIPPAIDLPPTAFVNSTDHITLAAASSPSIVSFQPGYYFLRHSFVFSNGTESALQAISNLVYFDGTQLFSVAGLPLGPNPGSLTCTARRLYFNAFKTVTMTTLDKRGDPIEKVQPFCQVNDNITTAFTTSFDGAGASTPVVGAIPSGTSIPSKSFNGHPAAPPSAMTAEMRVGTLAGAWMGGAFQFKYAYLYRDGSVSFASPASNTVALNMLYCNYIKGFNLRNITAGPSVNGFDVVARFIYYCQGALKKPNESWSTSGPFNPPCGFTYSSGFNDPDWSGGLVGTILGAIIPENTSTELLAKSEGAYIGMLEAVAQQGSIYNSMDPGSGVGYGNKPYENGNGQIVSSDPIPIWPNPDGPFLEDTDPPADLDDVNEDLLHEDSGSQPFSVTTDSSQVRNRVIVKGTGSLVSIDAKIGDTLLYVADISAFSPAGGQVEIVNASTGERKLIDFRGLEGVAGAAGITLAGSLTAPIQQGSTVVNYFMAEDIESQKFMARAELDKDGNPTDGIHEYVIVDTSLKASWQLFMRAYAELELFSRPIVTIHYATRDPKSKSGQTVHVDLSQPPCEGDFLIQEVTIDQFHDESDQLNPRYTVTASSVKYELNDLLLAIVGQSGGSGVSAAGLTPSAQFQSNSNSIGVPIPTAGRIIAWSGNTPDNNFGTGTQPARFAVGLNNNWGSVGTGTGNTDADGHWTRITSTAGGGDEFAYVFPNITSGWTWMDHNPYWSCIIKTGDSIDSIRAWGAVMFDTNVANAATNSNGVKGVGIRYDSTITNSWQAVTGDGSSVFTFANITPIAPRTVYALSIKVDFAGLSAKFTVNGAAQTLTLPGNLSQLAMNSRCRFFNNSAALTRFVDFKVGYIERL